MMGGILAVLEYELLVNGLTYLFAFYAKRTTHWVVILMKKIWDKLDVADAH